MKVRPGETSAPRAPTPGAAPPRDVALDRMRGLAILLVVAYHAGPLAWRIPPYGPTGLLEPPPLGPWWLAAPLLHFGFVGVHLFFVISGFCIHASARGGRLLFPTAGGGLDSGGLRRYAVRRLARIAPPYWIALLLFGVVVPRLAAALQVSPPGGAGPASAGDLALHALFLHGLFERTIFSIDPAFWSLATEMEFYAAYPLVAWALLRFGARRVVVASLLMALGWRAVVLWRWAPTVSNFMVYRVWLHGFFVPRWYEWILGCWLAEAAGAGGLDRRDRWGGPAWIAGLSLLAMGMLCRAHVALDKLFGDLLFGTGFALLLGAALSAERTVEPDQVAGGASGAASRLLSWPLRGLGAVGRRSYGIYLAHQPILDGEWLALLPRLLLAGLASALFAIGLERPFERLARRLGRPPGSAPEARAAAAGGAQRE